MGKVRIMLDAGHYGKYNRSPVLPSYYESEMAWKLHILLQAELEKYGFDVGTTRKDPAKDLTVDKRGKLAKGYDLFISLHSNARWDKTVPASHPDNIRNEKVDKVSVFHSFDNRNDSRVLGTELMMAIQKVMQCNEDPQLRIRKNSAGTGEYYGVLRNARSAGCPLYYIIEHSYHTNLMASEWLSQGENLQKLAEVEAAVIAKYYGLAKDLVKGDVNGDGKVDVKDYLLAKRIFMGTYEPTPEELWAADVNDDGKVDGRDIIAIKRIYLGTYPLVQQIKDYLAFLLGTYK